MKYFNIILTFLISLAISCQKDESGSVKYGSLNGIVTNEYGQPLEGAAIDNGSGSVKMTNEYGIYTFGKLPVKEFTITASKENFITKVQSVTIVADKLVSLDFSLASGNAFIDISDTAVQVHPAGGKIMVNVTSNAGWIVATNSSWLSLSMTIGEGNSEVGINYTASNELIDRSDTVYFVCGPIIKRFAVQQECPVKLIKHEYVIGNLITNVSDSVYFYFNKPVRVINLQGNCPLNYDNTGFKASVLSSCGCMELLTQTPFHFTVEDEHGNQLESSVEIGIYKSRLHLDGSITDYVLINNDKEVLISAYNPSRIVRYSIAEDKILQVYDLSGYIAPLRIFQNPYNSKIYIVGTDPMTYIALPVIDLPDVYSLDPVNGVITKEITFVPDSLDHPDYPTIIPYYMGFTKTGLGIVCLKSPSPGMIYRWKMMDISNNNSVFEYPYYNQDLDHTFLWSSIHQNYDNSKLVLVHLYGLCKYGIFDSSTGRIELVMASDNSNAGYIRPFRLSDRFYAAQTLEQFIMDINGNILSNGISQLDVLGLTADFSYRPGEENIIYEWDWDYFNILDYENLSNVMSIKTPYKSGNIKSTIDGKYILALKYLDVYATDFYVIDIQSLYRNVK